MQTGLIEKLKEAEKRLNEIHEYLSSPDAIKDRNKFVSLSQEANGLTEAVRIWERYQVVETKISEDNKVLSSNDDELKALAKEEIAELETEKAGILKEIIDFFTPNDPNDSRNAIMEIRQGAGGDEASIFAGDLFRMYLKYAESKRWQVDIMSNHSTEIGGIKEVIFNVKGKNVYKFLKYESGTHRVQRVPKTESSGRIHTSTVTVAVLPEASEIDAKINPEDIRIETYRAGGHGGQNVNKVESAVRLIYIPTNLIVTCQDERSQLQNRERAMKILYAKIYAEAAEKHHSEIQATRTQQIGSGDRSEKIRTYNFTQQRVTDHRINLSLHKLDMILNGDLDEFITALQDENRRSIETGNTNPKE
ncbi:MAG: peptide chain release factor 1 [bacterium]